MSDDAYRGAGAALERVAVLERELAELRAENARLKRELATAAMDRDELRAKLARSGPVTFVDDRDVALRRALEERDDLARDLRALRERYDAEPPESRDPARLERSILDVLSRLF